MTIMERLQKILAQAGVASRRKSEELILAGKVTVNGEVVTELGTKADPTVDEITVNGRSIAAEKKVYYMFNKPKGVITSVTDPEGRKTVQDYLKGVNERVFPVGRLDYDSEGLLILTNDGELANRLTHPKHHVPKTYLVTVEGVPHGDSLEKFRRGIQLEDGMTQPAEAEYYDIDTDKKQATIRVTIYEGKNRQIRRMFDALSHKVIRLKRIAFGELLIGNLKRGLHRPLSKQELDALQKGSK